MVRVQFIGTCSGTEPYAGRHHTSFVIDTGEMNYWFDAGEGCSRNAYLNGVDLLKVRAVFISHPHYDHIGGLGGLMWNIRKLHFKFKKRLVGEKLDIYVPNLESWNGILQMLNNTEGNFKCDYEINSHLVKDGVVYEDGNIRVTAYHNLHMQEEEGDGWLSFSYVIEADGKKIVYSGDVKTLLELDGAISDGCDCLFIETGHHSIESIAQFVNARNIGKIFFVHHGVEILKDFEGAKEKIEAIKCGAILTNDGNMFEL